MNTKKQLPLCFTIITFLLTFSAFCQNIQSGQQNVYNTNNQKPDSNQLTNGSNSNTNINAIQCNDPTPNDLKDNQANWIEYPVSIKLSHNNKDSLRLLIKKEVIKSLFLDDASENTKFLYNILIDHAGSLVKMEEWDPYIKPNSNKTLYTFEIYSAKANRRLYEYIKERVDYLINNNTLVGYNPINAGTTSLIINKFEDARNSFLEELISSQYRIAQIKELPSMQECNLPEKPDTFNVCYHTDVYKSPVKNDYRDFLLCMKYHSEEQASLGFIVDNISAQEDPNKLNNYEVKVTLKAMNLYTQTLVFQKTYDTIVTVNDAMYARSQAIKVIENNTPHFMKEFTDKLYQIIINGWEVNLKICNECTQNNDIFNEFKTNIENCKYFMPKQTGVFRNQNGDDIGTTIPYKVYVKSQYELIKILNSLKPETMNCKFEANGEDIFLKPMQK
ncbi:MAG: hypothetical protein ABIJ97_05610 [Bacteroidota bacterium]